MSRAPDCPAGPAASRPTGEGARPVAGSSGLGRLDAVYAEAGQQVVGEFLSEYPVSAWWYSSRLGQRGLAVPGT
jgi:hypothetical protein